MLPDLRAIIAALVTSLGVVLIGFGVVVTLRTAHDRTVSPLQETRERLRANPFAAAPPIVITAPIEVPALPLNGEAPAADERKLAAAEPLSVPEFPQAKPEPVAPTQADGDRTVEAAPEPPASAEPPRADTNTPAEPPSQTAAAADQPTERFIIESLVCPPATTAPEPTLSAASAEPASASDASPVTAGVPLPRERPAMGGPAPDELGVTGSLQPSRSTAEPPRAVQKRGAKRLAARVAPRKRPAPRSRPAPAPRQKGLFEALFGR